MSVTQPDPVFSSAVSPQIPLSLDANYRKCELCTCPRYFKGDRGLRIHTSRIHKADSSTSDGVQVHQVPNNGSCSQSSSHAGPFWHYLAKCKNNIPVVKRIPRGARLSVADSLRRVIDRVVAEGTVNSWEDLFTFSFKILHVTKNDKNSLSLTQKIKNNCLNPNIFNFKNTKDVSNVGRTNLI